jgi:Domain of unknown function (DUF3291)
LEGWHDDGVNYLLAQVNIGRMLAPLDSVQLADFAEALDPVKAALWWIPAGHTPTTAEAEGRVLHLREFGPTPYAFTLREHFPPPDATDSRPTRSPEDWTCPA